MIRHFTDQQLASIVKRYVGGESSMSIAEDSKCSSGTILKRLRSLSIHIRTNEENIEYMPTQKEIRENAAEVRAGWTPEIEESRRMTKNDPVIFTHCGRGILVNGKRIEAI